jgi:hypothetical protein
MEKAFQDGDASPIISRFQLFYLSGGCRKLWITTAGDEWWW